jgi:hypothetical protein
MTDKAPNPWLVFAMPYFCFIPTMPVSYQNFMAKEQDDDDEIQIKDWRRKKRKSYTRKAPFRPVPEYEALKKDIEIFIRKNKYLQIGQIYDMMDALGLIPTSRIYGEKLTKGAFSHHLKQVKKTMRNFKNAETS